MTSRVCSRRNAQRSYVYVTRLIAGPMAFLEWTAEAAHTRVRDGADSFLIENGWIVAQTIHYTVEDDRTPDTPR